MKHIFKNESSIYNFDSKPMISNGLCHKSWSFTKKQNNSLFGSIIVAVVISTIVYFTILT
ncbi:MAG: hypothetical protein U9Q33_09380 [Campylobacterota bacterium]|nr:hypothetical protein [Campylobacterota bacterium]